MSDDNAEPTDPVDTIEDIPVGILHVPILLRRFRAPQSDQPQIAGLDEPSIAGEAAPNGDHVAAVLAVKYMKLETAITALRAKLPTITEPELRIDVTTQIGEAEAERSLCKARHDQIDAGGAFKEPPQSEENALLAAIDAVEKSLAVTNAVAGLLAAVHKLVTAFPGSKT